jgi:hypothetical protein
VPVLSTNTSRAESNTNCYHRQQRRHVRPELFRGAQVIFFEGNIMSSKSCQTPVRLPAVRRFCIAATISSSVKSGCSATTARGHFARSSNGGCHHRRGRRPPAETCAKGSPKQHNANARSARQES